VVALPLIVAFVPKLPLETHQVWSDTIKGRIHSASGYTPLAPCPRSLFICCPTMLPTCRLSEQPGFHRGGVPNTRS
jgi:hypothetical protein